MNGATRERELIDAFAALADTLVADYDVFELLQHLVETCGSLFEVDAVGLLLADPSSGTLDVVASTSEEVHTVEVMQLGAESGPCIEAFETGRQVAVPDIAASRWDRFRRSALEQGYRAVFAVPLRLRQDVIGAMGMFSRVVGDLNERDLRAAQGLADVAAIGILHSRTVDASNLLRDQLQHALTSRIVIEQAKGVLAQTHSVGVEEAFQLLRAYARSHQQPLADVAARLVARTLVF